MIYGANSQGTVGEVADRWERAASLASEAAAREPGYSDLASAIHGYARLARTAERRGAEYFNYGGDDDFLDNQEMSDKSKYLDEAQSKCEGFDGWPL